MLTNHSRVLHIAPQKIVESWKGQSGASKITSDVCILDPREERFPSSIQSCKYGDTFLKCPYDGNWYHIREYEEKSLQVRLYCIEQILRKLGATHIEETRYIVKTSKRAIYGSGNVSSLNSNIDGHINQSSSSISQEGEIQRYDYKGISSLSRSDWETVRAYAQVHNLLNDTVVKSLLNGRHPDEANQTQKFSKETMMSDETNETLDIAFSLNFVKIFKLNAEFREKTKNRIERKTKFEVIF